MAMATSSQTLKGPEVEVVYYALGGGMGHLTRGLAIARQFRKQRGPSIVLMTNSPHADLAERESVLCVHIAADNCTTSESLRQQIAQHLQSLAPRLLIMDTFPRGVLGEMAPIVARGSFKKIWVKRYLNPRYVHAKEIVPFVNLHFDEVIFCEHQPELDSQFQLPCVPVGPVVIRSPDELLPRDTARSRLGCRGQEFSILGVGSGSEDQVRWFFKLLSKVFAQLSGRRDIYHSEESERALIPNERSLALALSSLTKSCEPDWEARRLDYYPLVELMCGVDLVVGASGYNLFYETQCAGVEAVFLPQARRYDDQFWRAGDRAARGPEELRSMIAEKWIARRPESVAHSFQNGAVEAAKAIANSLGND